MTWWLFNQKDNHVCTVSRGSSKSFLSPLQPDANCFQRFAHNFRKSILICEAVPRSVEYYRSAAEINHMRKKHVRTYPCIIHPFSKFRAFYEMWMALVFLVTLVYSPVASAFPKENKAQELHLLIFETLLSIFCFVDIFITFFTGYTIPSKKKVVLDPGKIFNIRFPCDVLSSLPDPFVLGYDRMMIFSIFGLLKIARLPTLFFYLIRTAEIFRKRNKWFKTFKFSLTTYIVIHWFACLHFLVPQCRLDVFGNFHNSSWIMKDKLFYKDFTTQYVSSFYSASGYLLCIDFGQGRISLLWEEFLTAIFTFIFGKVFVMFLTVIILQMFMEERSLETKYYETMSQVEGYMRQKQLPLSMQSRIVHYYAYKYNRKFFKDNVIASLLSDKLKKEINMHVCKKLVQNVTLFDELPAKIVADILNQLRPEIFLPNDIIIKAGTTGDCMYFLDNGTVAVSTPSGKEICHLQDGAYFGEISLLIKNKKRTANIVAVEICEVYKLERKMFKSCFLSDPQLFKKIEETAKDRMQMTDAVENAHRNRFFDTFVQIPQ